MSLDGQAPSPAAAQSVEELVASMRALKEYSGLSLRQLGERAEELGDVLPRSTLADVLSRSTAPRPDLLAAFVRACGGDAHDVREWLAVRERVLAADSPKAPAGSDERRRRVPLAAAGAALAALVALVGLGVWLWWPDGGEQEAGSGGLPFPDGQVAIHPSHAPDLCLTEGRQRSGPYDSAVAVQGPCDGADLPDTFLRAVGVDDWYFVEWYKPTEGRGCLTRIPDGAAAGLFEPVDESQCSDSAPEQHFRLEPADGSDSREPAYLLRHSHTDQCLTFADGGEAEGAEAVLGSCDEGAASTFLIDTTP